ncbi:hypothetical protein ACFZC6_03935 [Streptomyces ossamyceticus]|uniref:Secreted protein n=1 Tax=Streptomyces ossamyceticus TaxID=249581 RepID=A0ABV2V0F8_9ACTN
MAPGPGIALVVVQPVAVVPNSPGRPEPRLARVARRPSTYSWRVSRPPTPARDTPSRSGSGRHPVTGRPPLSVTFSWPGVPKPYAW